VHTSKNSMATEEPRFPKRATRGQRVRRLVGEEAEADEAFWGQTAFQDGASDDSFEFSGTSEDSEDTDIDIDEADDARGRRKGEMVRGVV